MCDVFKGSTHHGGLGLSFRFSKLYVTYLQRDHVSKSGLASDLGRAHLRVTGRMDLSGWTSWRRQSVRTACLGKIATNSQILRQFHVDQPSPTLAQKPVYIRAQDTLTLD